MPLWSYRDVVWSSVLEDDKSKTLMKEFIRFLHNTEALNFHPTHFIHLFYADLIAAIMSREFHECFLQGGNSSKAFSESEMNSSVAINKILKQNEVQDNHLCLQGTEPFVEVRSRQIYRLQQTTKINMSSIYSVLPVNTKKWVLSEDKKGKFGWIDEGSINDECIQKAVVTINHNQRDRCYSSILSFPFSKSPSVSGKRNLIRIHYLKTYINAGIVDVYLCGKFLTSLDALWKDFNKYHYSYNDIYYFEYDSTITQHETEYGYCNGKELANKTELFKVEFKKVMNEELHNENQNPRNQQKFKVVDLKVCFVSN